ncbi:MAG: hypothetical protein WBG08_05605 [Litorimonas sp.]
MSDKAETASTVTDLRSRVRWRGFMILAVSFLVGLAAVLFLGRPIEVRLTDEMAQASLDAKLGEPVTGLFSATVIPETLDITFLESNRLALEADLALSGLGQDGRARGIIRAGIRYDAPHVFLRDIDASDLSVTLATASGASQRVADIGTVLRDRIRRERDAISGTEAGDAFDRLARDLTAGLAGTIPLYDLRDAGLGGSIAALALQDVRFEDGVAILTLSSRTALLRVLAAIGSVLLVLLFALSGPVSHLIVDRTLGRKLES